MGWSTDLNTRLLVSAPLEPPTYGFGLSEAGHSRAGTARAGMTLIEILMGTFILSVGLMGILSMFPVAMRAVEQTGGQTTGPAAGRNAALSLEMGEVDVWDYHDEYLDGRFRIKGTALTSWWHWPEAVYAYAQAYASSVDGTENNPTFRIGGEMTGLLLDDAPLEYVPFADTDYGWTATFLPLSDVTVTLDRTGYRVQIAVWRNYRSLIYSGVGRGYEYVYSGSTTRITIKDGATAAPGELEFAQRVSAGDYLRLDTLGIWYRIVEVEDPPKDGDNYLHVVVAGNVIHPRESDLRNLLSPISVASRFNLVGLYETVVTADR